MKMTPIMKTAVLVVTLLLFVLEYAAEHTEDDRDNRVAELLREVVNVINEPESAAEDDDDALTFREGG